MVREISTRALFGALVLSIGPSLPGCGSIMPDSLFPDQPHGPFEVFPELAPEEGGSAPDFELAALDGETVALSDLHGDRPVLLFVGCYTCPIFRYRQRWMRDLHREYGDRVHCLTIYTTEIHPVDAPSPLVGAEWDVMANVLTGVRLDQPASYEERSRRAILARDEMGLEMPVLVDAMDDGIWDAYGRPGAAAFVIDTNGRVALRQVFIDPDRIRETLDRLLGGAPEPSPRGD